MDDRNALVGIMLQFAAMRGDFGQTEESDTTPMLGAPIVEGVGSPQVIVPLKMIVDALLPESSEYAPVKYVPGAPLS